MKVKIALVPKSKYDEGVEKATYRVNSKGQRYIEGSKLNQVIKPSLKYITEIKIKYIDKYLEDKNKKDNEHYKVMYNITDGDWWQSHQPTVPQITEYNKSHKIHK